ncbi:MAG: hypothetical protein Tsb0013_02280 [Phycisphaerales bacterium]
MYRLVLVVMVLIASVQAWADGPTLSSVRAGWNDTLFADAWSPLRVEVQGGDESASGEIRVDIRYGGSVVASYRRPFAAAPDSRTRYEVPIRVPAGVGNPWSPEAWSIAVALRSSRGERFDEWDSRPRDASGAELISVDASTPLGRTVLLVSDPASASFALPNPYRGTVYSPDRTFTTAPPNSQNDRVLAQWFAVPRFEVDTSDLPARWRLLESVRSVVIHAPTLLRLSAAQREALLGWIRWGGQLIVLGDATLLDAGFRPDGVRTIEDVVRLDDGVSLPTRRWRNGLGGITLVSEQPADVAADSAQRMALWLELFSVQPMSDEEIQNPWMRSWSSGDETLDEIVMSFAEVQPPPVWWLFVFVGALALCIGPVDRFVLKRLRLLHRSWASALCWIALASLCGLVAPWFMTSGDSQCGTLTRLDVTPDGTVFVDRITAVYSASPHRASFVTGDQDRDVWQHALGGRYATQNVFTPVTTVGEGAVLPTLTVRTRSLVAVRERSISKDVPLEVEMLLDPSGAPIMQVRSERPFVVSSASLWTRDGVRSASVVRSGNTPASDTTFRGGFPFPLQAISDVAWWEELSDSATSNRSGAMLDFIQDPAHAIAVITLDFAEGDPVAGAPPDAVVRTRTVFARIPIRLNDAITDALDARP